MALESYTLKKPKRKYTVDPDKKRKRRSDRKGDIKIPIDEDIHSRILYLSERQGVSMESIATSTMVRALARNHDFPQVEYSDSDFTVHVKTDEEMRMALAAYQSKWGIKSKRKAAHRIFMHMVNQGVLGWM